MKTNFEKTLILSLGLICLWFFGTTLHFSTVISDMESLGKDKLGLLSNQSRGIASSTKYLHSISNKIQQIRFSPINDPLGIHKRVEMHRIPFPQSIQNEDWETIIHPSVIMRPKDHKETEDEKKEEEEKYKMQVPYFWSPSHVDNVREFLGENGKRLMTPQEAAQIGSYTPNLKRYDVEYGDADLELTYDDKMENIKKVNYIVDELPPKEVEMLETIFVAIASYRDYRCPHTVEQIFKQAKYPERIRVGIVDQLDPNEDKHCAFPEKSCFDDPEQILCKYAHQINVFEMDAQLAVGPVFARHIGNRMYRGEYFTMQCDAHMEFVNNWDEDVIEQWRSAENEMAVLTTYVSEVEDHYNKKTGERKRNTRPFMCESDFEQDYYDESLSFLMHGQQPEEKPSVVGEPLLIPFWAAGFSFARGHFVVQVPYDQYQPMIFQGEEINIGIRAWTYGYDFYAPEKSVLYHYYHTDPHNKKRTVKRFWEHENSYKGIGTVSKKRMLALIDMLGAPPAEINEQNTGDGEGSENAVNTNDEDGEYEVVDVEWVSIEADKYGSGQVRTVKKFLDTFGIDLVEKKKQNNLCEFVDEAMTRIFTKELRKDQMGIDYAKIDFKFKDPEKFGNTWENLVDK